MNNDEHCRYTKKASNHALKALRQLQKRASIVDGLNEDEGESGLDLQY